jgi:hypothetical protein
MYFKLKKIKNSLKIHILDIYVYLENQGSTEGPVVDLSV